MPRTEKPSDTQWTILKLLQWTTTYFESNAIDSPRATAELLLAHALGVHRIDLYLNYDQPLDAQERAAFKALILRRVAKEPTAYIEGRKGFWDLILKVSPAVLIPRPETECLVAAALDVMPDCPEPAGRRILELGVGSGAVTIALASERPHYLFFALDRSLPAVDVARDNLAAVEKTCGPVHLLAGDWFAAIRKKALFQVIVSNPPYIETAAFERLQPEIVRYEPRLALDGGDDGMEPIRQIIQWAPRYLLDAGYLLLEIGYDQKDAVDAIIQDSGCYDQITFIKDYGGHHRVVRMRKIPDSKRVP